MGFNPPDPSNFTYDPYLGDIRMSDTGYGTLANPFPVYWYVTAADGSVFKVSVDYATPGYPLVVELVSGPPTSSASLLEDGFYLLLEDGFKLLLE